MEFCMPYLRAQLKVVKPKVIVALGRTATNGLLQPDPSVKMGDLRGKWWEFEKIPVMVTYHPSYLLHNPSTSAKRRVWEDMLLVMERFEMFQLGLRIIGDAIAKWWNDLWSGIGSFFGTIWDGLQDIVRGAWNGIVGWIESGVNNAINLINGIIRGINNVGGAVGIHLNLIPNVNIPRLATGGITLGPQLAVVGDNRSGREAVVPLDDPRSAAMLRDAMGGSNAIDQATLDRTVEKLIRGLGNEIKRQLRDGGVVFP